MATKKKIYYYEPFMLIFLQNIVIMGATILFIMIGRKDIVFSILMVFVQCTILIAIFFRIIDNFSRLDLMQKEKSGKAYYSKFGENMTLNTDTNIQEKQLKEESISKETALDASLGNEMNGLQAQISPHFLCNTLESIRGQAMIIGDDTIAKMTEALSSLFRYSISGKGNIVSLKDEMDNVDKYMKIQKFRFGDRFNLIIKIDTLNDIREIFMPKLLLQPIVENCIRHGLMSKEEGGTIKIDVMQNLHIVTIDIRDDGVGMSEETLCGIIGKKSPSIASQNSDTAMGIGINNIIDRIKLYYGKEYGLKIYSTPNEGTQITVIFPFDEDIFKRKI